MSLRAPSAQALTNCDVSPDELSVISVEIDFLNLLNESLREQLLVDRSVDFSYQLPATDSGTRSPRFRATAYFDMEHVALNMRANAARNPKAVMKAPLSMEQYLAARMIRDPLVIRRDEHLVHAGNGHRRLP